MRKLVILLVVALLAISIGSTLRAQDSEAQYGGTLRAAWSAQWVALDPHTDSAASSFAVMSQVVEGLVTYDENTKLAGELATDWWQSEDGLTWTFQLREGVTFSNGAPLTADIVVWNMERILNPETGSGRKTDIGGEGAVWQAVDEMTVSVTLTSADAVFPYIFATFGGIGIVHPDSVVEETGQIVTPIGTGPFVIGEFEGTTSMTLVRNENYWQEGLPYLDSIDIIVIAENAAREAALRGGQVDWVMNVPAQSVGALEGDENIVIQRVAGLAYNYMGVNIREGRPGEDLAVRHAMAHAIDRAALCQVGNFGLCTPIQGPTGPSSPWYNDYAPYGTEDGGPDIEKARAILAEAGYSDGDISLTLMPTATYENTVRLAQVIQQTLKQIGIDADIYSPEWAEWLELEGGGDYDIYICGWGGLVDGNAYYTLQHKTDEIFNFTGFSDPDFDRLVDEARAVSDFDARYAIYDQANKIVVDGAPYIYFYNGIGTMAHLSNVIGYQMVAHGDTDFKTTWLSSE